MHSGTRPYDSSPNGSHLAITRLSQHGGTGSDFNRREHASLACSSPDIASVLAVDPCFR